jgi:hypothetical protein
MMSKKKAHVVIVFIDLLAMLIFWIGYNEINRVVVDIAHTADSVEFNNKVGLFFIGVGIPIIHLFIIYEHFWPKVVKRRIAWFNLFGIILLIFLFASAFFISARVRTYVERSGYLHCSPADHDMSFSIYLNYTKNDAICSRLIEEKSKPRRY